MWQAKPLKGHVFEVSTRKGSGEAEVLSVTNSQGFVRSLDVFDKQVFSEDLSNYKLVARNDVAYNPSRINVGSIAICDLPEGGAVSPMYVVFRCAPSISPNYLVHLLKSEVGLQHIVRRSVGSVRFILRFSDLEQIELPIPPIADQNRVVEILDSASQLLELRTIADKRTDDLIAALFDETFGNPVTNPLGWRTSVLGDETTMMEYGPRFYNEAYSESGTRIVRITDLENGGNLDFDTMPRIEVDEAVLKARGLQAGDFIFARTGATVGKIALVPEGSPPCIAGAYFIRFRLKDTINPLFARELLRSKAIQQRIQYQAKQTAQPNFSGPLLRALPLILPPVARQLRFARRLGEIRQLQTEQRAQCARFQSLSKSLAHQAIQGQL